MVELRRIVGAADGVSVMSLPGSNVCQEHHVDETFLNEMRERLQSRAAELRDTITRIDGTTAPISPNNAIGRLTRLDAMQATSMRRAVARDHDLELQNVERALKAIAANGYGVCRRCKEDIASARLRAKPEAFLCVACASL
jgi:DnaK suppressor protein